MLDRPTLQKLADLRAEIDRIDARMHEILMERGKIIDRLIEVKARAGGGSAFRPGREADMMRRLVSRHKGILPLDTVESIWRIIISTFTFVQAAYSVHGDIAGGDAPMRDCARFHFGFTVPFVPHAGTAGVIDAVAASAGDLGLLRVENSPATGAWWKRLARPDAPKIIARLPFVERRDHPAGMPLFVIAKPLTDDGAARDVVLYCVDFAQESEVPANPWVGAEIVGKAGNSLLVSAPATLDIKELPAGAQAKEVGSHAARFDFTAKPQRGAGS